MARSAALASKPVVVDVETQIKEISKGMKRNANVRANHFTQMALCGLKYLILRTESDSLRLAAIKTLLELPMVQARMGNMARQVGHYHQHVHVEDPTSKALVEKLTQALATGQTQELLDMISPAKSIEITPKPLETNETT